ncbi:MAG: hypothetical protein M3340_20320, partial [Actinomycetota bacterium]|nr:hypothetical protein [Actinomycetota bacterium]
PSGDHRRRRERLGEFLRGAEPAVHSAAGEAREEIRRLLGWDDASLHALVAADLVVHTSPHASMNAFDPMFAFPWVAATVASSAAEPSRAAHLRTTVTHNNLGDLRWRPYAWWHRAGDGALVKTSLFTRNAKLRHRVLLACPAPELDLAGAAAIDREAVALARHARSYAGFCLVYRSFVERHAGLHGSHPPVEAPIELLNAFSLGHDGVERWAAALAELGATFRTTDDSGRLVEVGEPAAVRPADVRARLLLCPNAANLAQVQLLGISVMVGAERMSKYVPEMADDMARLTGRLGLAHQPPELLGFTGIPIAEVLGHDARTVERFAEDGLRGSLPVGAADIGPEVAANLDRLLDRDCGGFVRPASETNGAGPS